MSTAKEDLSVASRSPHSSSASDTTSNGDSVQATEATSIATSDVECDASAKSDDREDVETADSPKVIDHREDVKTIESSSAINTDVVHAQGPGGSAAALSKDAEQYIELQPVENRSQCGTADVELHATIDDQHTVEAEETPDANGVIENSVGTKDTVDALSQDDDALRDGEGDDEEDDESIEDTAEDGTEDNQEKQDVQGQDSDDFDDNGSDGGWESASEGPTDEQVARRLQEQLDSNRYLESPHQESETDQSDTGTSAEAGSLETPGFPITPRYPSSTRRRRRKALAKTAKAGHDKRAGQAILPENDFFRIREQRIPSPKVVAKRQVYARHVLTNYQDHDDWMHVPNSLRMFSDGSEGKGLGIAYENADGSWTGHSIVVSVESSSASEAHAMLKLVQKAPQLLKDRRCDRLLILSDDKTLLEAFAGALDGFEQSQKTVQIAGPAQVQVRRKPSTLQAVCQQIYEGICGMKAQKITVQLGKVSGSDTQDSDGNMVADTLAKYANNNAAGHQHLEELPLQDYIIARLQLKASRALKLRLSRRQQSASLALPASHDGYIASEPNVSAVPEGERVSVPSSATAAIPHGHLGITERFNTAVSTNVTSMGEKRSHGSDDEFTSSREKRPKTAEMS